MTAQPLAGQSGDDAERRHRNVQAIFRFDTFGDEQLWTDVLRMHEMISTVDPATALAVGLKVDVEALPRTISAAFGGWPGDLTDPAVTLELLRLNAVVGNRVNHYDQQFNLNLTPAQKADLVEFLKSHQAASNGTVGRNALIGRVLVPL